MGYGLLTTEIVLENPVRRNSNLTQQMLRQQHLFLVYQCYFGSMEVR